MIFFLDYPNFPLFSLFLGPAPWLSQTGNCIP